MPSHLVLACSPPTNIFSDYFVEVATENCHACRSSSRDQEWFCTQLMKSYVAESSCSQVLLIEFAKYVLKINSLVISNVAMIHYDTIRMELTVIVNHRVLPMMSSFWQAIVLYGSNDVKTLQDNMFVVGC